MRLSSIPINALLLMPIGLFDSQATIDYP